MQSPKSDQCRFSVAHAWPCLFASALPAQSFVADHRVVLLLGLGVLALTILAAYALVQWMRSRNMYRRLSEEDDRLKRSEAMYRRVFESSRDAIFMLKSVVVWQSNQAAADLFGYASPAELNGAHPAQLSPIKQPDGTLSERKAEEMLQEALDKGTHFFEWLHKRKDGTEFWGEVLLSRFKHEGKYMVQAVLRDITERHETEYALRQSQQAMRAVFDQTFQFMGMLAPDGKVLAINQTALKFAGIQEEDVIGVHFADTPWWTHDRTQQKRLEEGIEQAAQGELFRMQTTHVSPDGELHHVDFTIKPVFGDNGLECLIPEGRDNTDRVKTEQQLRSSEQRYHIIFDRAPIGILHVSRDGMVLQANRCSGEILGSPAERFIGFNFLEHIVDQPLRASIDEALKGGEVTYQGPYKAVLSGKELQLRAKMTPLLDDNGDFEQGIVLLEDITEQQLAEQALRESEAQKNLVLNSLPMAFYTAHADGDYGGTWVSPQIKDISGFPPEQFIENRGLWAERLHPDDREIALGAFEQLDEDRALKTEYRWLHANGEYRWFQDNAVVITRPDATMQVIGTWTDITARRETEEALRESEERFRLLAENASDVIALHAADRSNRCLYISPSATTVFGYTPEEHYADPNLPRKYIHPDDLELLQKRDPAGDPITVRFIHRNGHTGWVEVRTAAQQGPDDEILAYESIARDVTDRRAAWQEARIQRDRFRSIMKNLALGLCILDEDLKIIDSNPKMKEWFPHQNHAYRCSLICDKENVHGTCAECPSAQTLRDGKIHEDISEFETAIGRRLLRTIACPLHSTDNDLQVIEIIEDVTERMRIEKQIQQVQKLQALGTLSSGIAHEINQPLSAIKLTSGILQRVMRHGELPDPEDVIRRVNRIAHSADEIDHIVQHIRSFIREDTEETTLNNINELVQDATYLLRAQLEAHNIQLEMDLHPTDITISVSSAQFQQVVSNLVTNARQALDEAQQEGKKIRIRTTISNDHAQLIVEDNGPGFGDHAPRIFDPFYTTRRPGVGLGLGLSMSHTYTSSWGGAINADSSELGGAAITITLPLAAQEES